MPLIIHKKYPPPLRIRSETIMMWLPSCPWPCFISETNVLLTGFSEIGEDVDSLAFGFFSEILIANGAF